MLVCDIASMRAGRPFRYWAVGNEVLEPLPPVDMKAFGEYYLFYENTKLFGLPGGRGWQHETPFALSLLRHFTRLTDQIENWQTRKANK